MPTSATHITVVQRLAREHGLQDLLGDPDPGLPEDDAARRRMRYACLGAVGPDFLYAMLDIRAELQELENFYVKIAGSIACLSELSEDITDHILDEATEVTHGIVDELRKTASAVVGTLKLLVQSLIVDQAGVNLFALFLPRRQEDRPPSEWYWADYLHYVRTGQFAKNLLDAAGGNERHRAYALGYLTHYVTDVVGHPYVNQVVGAPWRLGWQRHHLVENFIDAYVWDRWHTPAASEAMVDALVASPNAFGAGAPVIESRLHDHISIGPVGLDPVDGVIDEMCDKIRRGLFEIGVVERVDPEGGDDEDVDAWAELFLTAMRQTYADGTVPQNLVGLGRSDAFPSTDDLKSAYWVFRLALRMATEEGVAEPAEYSVTDAVVEQAREAIDAAIAAANAARNPPSPPSIPSDSFSIEDIFAALVGFFVETAEWIADTLEKLWDAVDEFINGPEEVAAAGVKALLAAIQRVLYGFYRDFRRVLMLQGYLLPLPDEVSTTLGGLDTELLWRAPDQPRERLSFPHEEDPDGQRPVTGNSYVPHLPPTTPLERPSQDDAGPWPRTHPFARLDQTRGTSPDDLLDLPLGSDDLFSAAGPLEYSADAGSFHGLRNFGGALANCLRGVELMRQGFPADAMLPDYNLDGDRAYAWPCWDVERGADGRPTTPLDPKNPVNQHPDGRYVEHVRAVPLR